MLQTAVLKLRNYTASVTLVLWYAAGLYSVYYTASISSDDNSQFSCIKYIFKILCFHTNAYYYYTSASVPLFTKIGSSPVKGCEGNCGPGGK